MPKDKPKKSKKPMGATPTGTSTITGLSSAKTLGTIPDNTNWCYIQAVSQNIRLRLDGTTTAPTSSTGIQIPAGKMLKVKGFLLSSIKIIEETASASAVVTFVQGNEGDIQLY